MPIAFAASRPGRVFLALVASFALAGLPAYAQSTTDRSLIELEKLRAETGREQQQASLRGGLSSLAGGAAVPLETAIDPATYVLGPGDVFSVSVGGAIPVLLPIPVAADGTLVIPDVGRFVAAGRTLAAVEAEIAVGLRRSFRNVQTEIALAQPRPFLVHVAGAVPNPGRHAVRPAARVEDALVIALAGASPLEMETEGRFTLALRSIVLERADGSSQTIDLRRYYALGDLSQNPMMRGGDVLRVRSFLEEDGVSVGGAVPQPGVVDLRPGDTAADVLALAAGSEDFSSLGPVRYVARGSKAARTLDRSEWASVTLAPGDRLLVADLDPDAGVAVVLGRVTFPGSFPIAVGTTTVGDLVAMAGGFREDALLTGAYLERRGSSEESRVLPGTSQRRLLAEEARSAELDLLLAAEAAAEGPSALPFSSRQYLATQRIRFPRLPVVTDGDGFDAATLSIRLQDGDQLVVPADAGGVLVLGQVAAPGYAPFLPGADAAHYVAQAGGQAPGASGVFVQAAPDAPYRTAGRDALMPGAVVFVDREAIGGTLDQQLLLLQEEQFALQQQQARRDARFRLFTTGLQVVSTAVGIVTTYLLIDQANSR